MKLQRDSVIDGATQGQMVDDDGSHLWFTLEHEWVDENGDGLGDTGVSRIPAGSYTCERFHSEKHPNTFQVMNVPGRTAILIHSGNTTDQTEGCILIGKGRGHLNGKPAVLQSRDAFAEFLAKFEDVDSFLLDVVDVQPEAV